MKFLRCEGEDFYLEFTSEEKDVLQLLLSFYPLVPATYHRLTQDAQQPKREENQQLLDEALSAQREQNGKAIRALLSEPGRFTETAEASQGRFGRGDLEWLLQVVNDVRVGSWIAQGSPGYEKKKGRPAKAKLRHALYMELAGAFEMFFLGVINGDVPPETPE